MNKWSDLDHLQHIIKIVLITYKLIYNQYFQHLETHQHEYIENDIAIFLIHQDSFQIYIPFLITNHQNLIKNDFLDILSILYILLLFLFLLEMNQQILMLFLV